MACLRTSELRAGSMAARISGQVSATTAPSWTRRSLCDDNLAIDDEALQFKAASVPAEPELAQVVGADRVVPDQAGSAARAEDARLRVRPHRAHCCVDVEVEPFGTDVIHDHVQHLEVNLFGELRSHAFELVDRFLRERERPYAVRRVEDHRCTADGAPGTVSFDLSMMAASAAGRRAPANSAHYVH